jgi:hypothetical protein
MRAGERYRKQKKEELKQLAALKRNKLQLKPIVEADAGSNASEMPPNLTIDASAFPKSP